MDIRTSRQIFNMEDLNSNLTGNEGQKQYLDFMDKKWVAVDDLINKLEHTCQFACLESWCASRHNEKGNYCRNCRNLKELFKDCNTDHEEGDD